MADIDNSTLLIGKTYKALRDWLAEHMTRYMDVSRDDTGGGGEDIDNSTLLIGKTYTGGGEDDWGSVILNTLFLGKPPEGI